MPNTPPDLTGDPGSPSPDDIDSGVAATDTAEAKPSITDLLKNPSKVVMCKVTIMFIPISSFLIIIVPK